MKPDRNAFVPRKPRLLALLLALFSASALAVGGPLPGANVESLLELARSRNPDFAAANHEAQAAAERVYPAGSLPDPTLRTELRDITNQGSDAAPSLLPSRIGSTKYTLIQPVPFWGKRDLRRDVAEAEAHQASGLAAQSWDELAASIKTLYAQYYALAETEKLTRELLEFAGSLEKISRARYASGLVPQQDVIRAQVEQTGMRAELVNIENEHHHSMVKLNALLSRPAMAPLAEPLALRPLPPPSRLDYGALEARMRSHNPQLFIAEERVVAATKSRELAYRNRYPDFNLGISPIQVGSRINEWELMIELNIPLQQKSRRSQEREAQSVLAAAESRRESTQNRLLAELAENLSALESARRVETLTRDSFLPQAELSFKSALAGYENGKVDFASLLDAQRQIRKAKLDMLKAQAEEQTRLAEMERLLGEDL
ncbi:MAG: TolC family protein [Sulfuricella sp.]